MVSMVTAEETGAHSNEAGYSASTQGAKAVGHSRKIRIDTKSEWVASLPVSSPLRRDSSSEPCFWSWAKFLPTSIPFSHHQSFLKLFCALSPFADEEMEAASQDCWAFEMWLWPSYASCSSRLLINLIYTAPLRSSPAPGKELESRVWEQSERSYLWGCHMHWFRVHLSPNIIDSKIFLKMSLWKIISSEDGDSLVCKVLGT